MTVSHRRLVQIITIEFKHVLTLITTWQKIMPTYQKAEMRHFMQVMAGNADIVKFFERPDFGSTGIHGLRVCNVDIIRTGDILRGIHVVSSHNADRNYDDGLICHTGRLGAV